MGDKQDQVLVDQRLDSLEQFRDDMEARWDAAFPNGDHVGHCRYHELMIQEIEDRRRLIGAVREKTISGLVWAGLVVLALALWSWVKKQVHLE